MKKKKEHHEEHVDETWLIPYADMLTLLLALFIVMFAMSQVDKEKLKQTSAQFNAIFSSGSGMLESDGNSAVSMEQVGTSDAEKAATEAATATATEEDKMSEIKKSIEQQINKEGYSDKVQVELSNGGLEIAIQDVILFNSGDADVLKNVYPLLQQISSTIYNLDNEIKIVGHTDNVPINNGKYRSNWDLSSIRAVNVMNFMVNTGGLNQKNVSIQAYADQKPKFDNSTEDGKAKNRRVEIIIVRKYPAKPAETNNK